MQCITTKSQFLENIRLQEWTMAFIAHLSQVLDLNQYAIKKSVQLQFNPLSIYDRLSIKLRIFRLVIDINA